MPGSNLTRGLQDYINSPRLSGRRDLHGEVIIGKRHGAFVIVELTDIGDINVVSRYGKESLEPGSTAGYRIAVINKGAGKIGVSRSGHRCGTSRGCACSGHKVYADGGTRGKV